MAENDNRGPNDPTPFRRPQSGRKRREPPLIDGSATEISTSPQPGSEPIVPSAEKPFESHAAEAGPSPADPVPAEAGASQTEVGPSPAEPGPLPAELSPAPAEPGLAPAEPVLFGAPVHSPAEGEAPSEPPEPQAIDTGLSEPPAVLTEQGAHPEAPQAPPTEVSAPDAAPDHHEPETVMAAQDTDKPATEDALAAASLGTSPAELGGAIASSRMLDDDAPADAPNRFAAGAPPPPPKDRSGFSPFALLLGLVALGLLGTVAWLLLAEPQRGDTRELAATLEALQGRVAALEAKPDPAEAATKVAAIETQLGALHATTDSFAKQLDELRAKLEAAPVAPAAAAAPAAPPVDLAPLQAKLSDLEGQVASLASAPKPTIPPSVDLGPTLSRINDLDNRLSTVQTTLSNLPKVDLQPLAAANAALDRRLTAIEAVLSAPKANDRVTEARANGSADVSRAAPLAVVSQALLASIDDGQPFGPELDALKVLGTDAATLQPLEPLAAKGAPTVAALRAQWDNVEGDVLAAVKPERTGNVLQRFAAGARALVQIHPVGAVQGEDAAAIVARIGNDLAHGSLEPALAEWARLPEPGKAAARDWAAATKARLDAEHAAQALVNKAIAVLGQAKG